MIRRVISIAIPIVWLLNGCATTGPNQSPNLPFLVTLTTEAPSLVAPQIIQKLAVETETAIPTQISAEIATATPTDIQPTPIITPEPSTTAVITIPATPPTNIPFYPSPTETLLPQLELPTEQPRAPALVPWTGQPTYPGDSDPGLLFRMDYDPDTWAQTEGLFGDIVLGNRQIEYCTITPWAGRGLPMGLKVTHDFRIIGSASFDVNTVTDQDVTKFVTYIGGDSHMLTGFQVTFNEQKDKCLQDAEMIFGTLRSFAAKPTATPIPAPETSTP